MKERKEIEMYFEPTICQMLFALSHYSSSMSFLLLIPFYRFKKNKMRLKKD